MSIHGNTDEIGYTGIQGIGGWLLFFTITAIIRPLYIAYDTFSTFLPVLTGETWYSLTSPSSLFYHRLWKPIIIFELAANIISILLALVALFLLFKKSRFFIKMWLFCAIISILFIGIDIILCSQIPALGRESFEVLFHSLLQSIGYLTIWGLYLKKSSRAKNTFIK
ncbi:DUF2569 family protein [Marinisporobacter balticus]|uniref:Uncharacterized protein DUF2569 n=1 Tax=Marinisporobacter balticus TaxID=2018667 RepID=A0A4R2L8W0_9FIRM|nr:DUF2569 family protein [Marinisporobacter balticus]TCO79158.1 uncharacterized protein DUF2569 [Marinisporobacter balticus]